MPKKREFEEKEEARIGTKGEEVLVRALVSRKDVIACLEDLSSVKMGEVREVKRGSECGLWKTDVLLVGSTGARVGVSLKTVKAGGRPDVHLDRRWIIKPSRRARSWSEVLRMPSDVTEILQRGILNIAAGKTTQLVPNPSDQRRIREFLEGALGNLLEEAFRNDERELLILAILEYDKRLRLCLFSMDDVIDFIEKDVREKGISFGNRINVGSYIQLQRKAGNGKHVKRLKTDPEHPGNQLQVKLLARTLRDVAVKRLRSCCFDIAP
jgi:hypothetical protein